MELPCGTSFKIKFEDLSLPEFFICISKEHLEASPGTSQQGITTFWNYVSAKETFSAMAAFKYKYCSCLQLESDLRVAVLMIQPKMSHLVSNMQTHPSH
jgi:hypothetical protein